MLAFALGAGCTDKVDGVPPVGGEESSAIEQERFLRRLHLDLTSAAPDDDYLAAALARLAAEGDHAATRGALAGDLLDDARFADTYVAELENRVFAGDTLDGRYDFICSILRAAVPQCMACGPPVGGDPCSACECMQLAALEAERGALGAAAADLAAGDLTPGTVERSYAGSYVYRYFYNDAATQAMALFDQFLGRPAEPDELVNASSMVIGALLPDNPAGLLFLRHGSNYDDLIDILFSSEVYREAAVNLVFQRYLGRSASPAELRFFVADLDAGAPDLTPVIRAVVSSREYFEQ